MKPKLLINLNFILFFPTAILMYEQHDYKLKLERMELVSFNTKHASLVKINNFKYNRTSTAINCTLNFKTAFGNELRAELQAFKFSSNEYRLFPITFAINICDVIQKNDFGLQNLYNCGNFPKCPMTKGHFLLCNWAPDYSKFPPYMPPGRYMAEINFTYHSEDVYKVQVFIDVNTVLPF